MQVELPLMAMSTELGVALSTLKRSKRAALISEDKDTYHLFTAGSIVVGRSRGVKTLADLESDARSAKPQVLMRPSTRPRRGGIAGLEHSQLGSGSGETKAGRTAGRKGPSGNYVVDHIVGKIAFIDLVDKDLVAKYGASPSDCYCDGPRHHDTFNMVVHDGDECPYNDGHNIVCAT
jgi:hypothetical protein